MGQTIPTPSIESKQVPRDSFNAQMKLYYFKSRFGNFGDDLNEQLWPQVIPGIRNSEAADWLVGIGTILNEKLLTLGGRILICGTGYRPSNWVPVVQPRWTISFVRGPLSAKALGLGKETAVTDPALMVSEYWKPAGRTTARVAFIPHMFTASLVDCRMACEEAGVEFIDPRSNIDETIKAISSVERVIAEAMHGAIVADALGIPWTRIKLLGWRHETARVSEFKWADWAATLGVSATPEVEADIPCRFGRGSRLGNKLLAPVQVRETGLAIRKAALQSAYQLSDQKLRARLRQLLVERVHTTLNA